MRRRQALLALLLVTLFFAASCSRLSPAAKQRRAQLERQRELAERREFCASPVWEGGKDSAMWGVNSMRIVGGGAGPLGAIFGLTTSTIVSPAASSSSSIRYTSVCEDGKPERNAAVFILDSYDQLMVDSARGRGEHVNALAGLLGVPPPRRDAFRAGMKRAVPAMVTHGRMEMYRRSLALSGRQH